MTDSDDIQRTELLKTDARGRVRSTQQQRDAVLNAYGASGLSGPEFSRIHGIKYQTFATWRQERRGSREGDNSKSTVATQSITLVEATPAEQPASCLSVALPGGAVMEIGSDHQLRLAARLIAELAATRTGGGRC